MFTSSSSQVRVVMFVCLLSAVYGSTTWWSNYHYGSLNCSDSALLGVQALAMGTCYASNDKSFVMNCASNDETVDVSCIGYNSTDCSGSPIEGIFKCPYNFELPKTCLGGYQAKCEIDPTWLSWPGYVLFNNATEISQDTCQANLPVSIFGYNPSCVTFEYSPFIKYSEQGVVLENNLVLQTYIKPNCEGPYTQLTLIENLGSCHQKEIGGNTVGASSEYVYGAPALADIPSVEYAEGTTSSTPSTSKSGLSKGAIAGIVIGSTIGVAVLGWFVYYFLFKKKNSEIYAGLLPNEGA